MSPFEQLEALYAVHPQEEPFLNYVAHHARHGFVFARPDFFAMGRAVRRNASPEEIRDPRRLFTREEADCWFIHAAAGNLPRIWQIVPWPLGWIAWERIRDPLSELIIVPVETLQRLCPPDFVGIK